MNEKGLPVIPRFRVWLPDPDVEKMLRVKALVYEHDKTRCVCGYAYDFYLEDEDATIMRSTGLLDTFGTEIFEGDIITKDEGETFGIVRYGICHSSLCFYVEQNYKGSELTYPINPNFSRYYKVVGNIYENPKLLGQ